MTRNTSFALSDHFADFIDKQVASGRYGSASDVIRDGLRLLEDHERRRQVLDAALQEGLESGPAVPFDFDEFLEEMHGRYLGKDAVA